MLSNDFNDLQIYLAYSVEKEDHDALSKTPVLLTPYGTQGTQWALREP
jgi:hypothetical protein